MSITSLCTFFSFFFTLIWCRIQTGNSDYALHLNGLVGQFVCSEQISNYPTEALTLTMWVYTEPQGSTGGLIYNSGTFSTDGEVTILSNYPTTLVVMNDFAEGPSIPQLEWQVLVFQWSSKTGLIEYYVNWENIISQVANDTIGSLLSPQQWLLMGQDSDHAPAIPPWDLGSGYRGFIDEMFIWNRTVPLSELQSIFSGQSMELTQTNKDGLVAYWPFSEGFGFVAKDQISGWELYLGGGSELISFDPSHSPLWVISDAPLQKNVFTTFYTPNQTTLIEIPVTTIQTNQTGGSPVSNNFRIRLTSLPDLGKIFLFTKEGTVGKEVVKVPQTLTENKVWFFYQNNLTSPKQRIQFSYQIVETEVNNEIQTDATVQLQANLAPVVDSYSNSTFEDVPTTVVLFAQDPEGVDLIYRISQLPQNGRVFHFESQIPIQLGDQVNDSQHRILYQNHKNAFGSDLSTIGFEVSDGVFTTQGSIVLSVIQVSDPPEVSDIWLTFDEDQPIMIDLTNVSDPDSGFDLILIKEIVSLPGVGKLFQFNNETQEKGSEIVNTYQGQPSGVITQFVSSVLNYSTQFNQSGRWTVKELIGSPDCPAQYCDATPQTDCSQAWCPLTQGSGVDGKGLEFLDVLFESSVYLRSIYFYEILNGGCVFQIEGFLSSQSNLTNNTFDSSQRILIWKGDPQVGISEVARIFSPSVCHTDQRIIGLRILLNTSAVPGWNEIDAISMLGTVQPQQGMVIGGKTILYEPGPDWFGDLDFLFAVDDCSGLSTQAQIHLSIRPVNDAPRQLVSSSGGGPSPSQRVVLGEVSWVNLQAYDVENDSMIWFIMELPQQGYLVDPKIHNVSNSLTSVPGKDLAIQTVDYRLEGGQVLYVATSETELTGSFGWRVEDVHGASSETFNQTLRVSCGPGYRRYFPRSANSSAPPTTGSRCILCGMDTFANQTDSPTCYPCPTGYGTETSGASSCEIQKKTISEDASIVVIVFSSFVGLYSVMILVTLTANRDMKPIRASNFLFCVIIVFGSLLVCSSCFISSVTVNSDQHCSIPPWFLSIGMSMGLCAIIIKNYYVYNLFRSTSLISRKVSNVTLLSFVGLGILPSLVIMIVWQVVDGGFQQTTKLIDPSYVLACSSQHQWMYRGILYAYNGFLLVLCLLIAVISRKVRSEFNESKLLAICIYNISICSLLTAVVYSLLQASPSAQFIVTQSFILLSVVSTNTIFFGYKFYRCMVKPDTTKIMSTIQPSSDTTSTL